MPQTKPVLHPSFGWVKLDCVNILQKGCPKSYVLRMMLCTWEPTSLLALNWTSGWENCPHWSISRSSHEFQWCNYSFGWWSRYQCMCVCVCVCVLYKRNTSDPTSPPKKKLSQKKRKEKKKVSPSFFKILKIFFASVMTSQKFCSVSEGNFIKHIFSSRMQISRS